MAASLHNQGDRNQRDRVVDADSQPQIVVFTNRKTFVEPAGFSKQPLRHHNRRRTHQTEIEAGPENITGRLGVFGLGIHPDPAANPDFFGLADLNVGVLLHERCLDFQFSRHPEVVRIQERYIPPRCAIDAVVARGRHAVSLLRDAPYIGAVLRQTFKGGVSGTIIDNNELPRPIALCQDRCDSLPDHGPTVVGGDNDAYDGRHGSTRLS